MALSVCQCVCVCQCVGVLASRSASPDGKIHTHNVEEILKIVENQNQKKKKMPGILEISSEDSRGEDWRFFRINNWKLIGRKNDEKND